MIRNHAMAALITLFMLGNAQAADDLTQVISEEIGTVNLYIINTYMPVPAAPMGMGGGGMGGGFEPRFDVMRLYVDDKFVGNSLMRHIDIRPELKLPYGEHAIRIECDGFKPLETKIHVLGNGSTQWLVVKLDRVEKAPNAKPAPGANSAPGAKSAPK